MKTLAFNVETPYLCRRFLNQTALIINAKDNVSGWNHCLRAVPNSIN